MSKSPEAWMTKNYNKLKDKPLKEICLIGTYNSASYNFVNKEFYTGYDIGGTFGSFHRSLYKFSNHDYTIQKQLDHGVRFLYIDVVMSLDTNSNLKWYVTDKYLNPKQYYNNNGHLAYKKSVFLGNKNCELDEFMRNIKIFFNTPDKKNELVILYIHDAGKLDGTEYRDLTYIEWKGLSDACMSIWNNPPSSAVLLNNFAKSYEHNLSKHESIVTKKFSTFFHEGYNGAFLMIAPPYIDPKTEDIKYFHDYDYNGNVFGCGFLTTDRNFPITEYYHKSKNWKNLADKHAKSLQDDTTSYMQKKSTLLIWSSLKDKSDIVASIACENMQEESSEIWLKALRKYSREFSNIVLEALADGKKLEDFDTRPMHNIPLEELIKMLQHYCNSKFLPSIICIDDPGYNAIPWDSKDEIAYNSILELSSWLMGDGNYAFLE